MNIMNFFITIIGSLKLVLEHETSHLPHTNL